MRRYSKEKPERFILKANILVMSLILLGLTGWVDYITGVNVSFMPFYLLPVALSARYAGLFIGVVFSVLGGMVWLWADLAAGNEYFYVFVPLWNALVRVIFFLSPVFFLELRKALAREREESRKDYLTRVFNRKGFLEAVSVELERSKRYRHQLTAITIDCDRFKQVNERFGRQNGDVLLQAVARTLREGLRSSDIVGRTGGDEFTIVLAETGYEQSRRLMSRLWEQLNGAMRRLNRPLTFTAGAVTFEKIPPSVVELMRQCEKTMKTVKSKGRDRMEHGIFQV